MSCNFNVKWIIMTNFIFQHPEFSFMLKERVCPLVIKLFSPSLKYRQGVPPPPSPAPAEKPFFPIVMRLLRIVSILIKFYYQLLVSALNFYFSHTFSDCNQVKFMLVHKNTSLEGMYC